jgi:hypothetical protein
MKSFILLGVILMIPSIVAAECKVVEYADKVEVVCEGQSLPPAEQLREKMPVEKLQIPQASSEDVIESHIDGEFSGWDGKTIFKLTNGQIWQQAAYAYTYRYKYRPQVLIVKTTGGYEMQVEDMDKRLRVVRIK